MDRDQDKKTSSGFSVGPVGHVKSGASAEY